MKVYETIISILEKEGPLPLPAICRKVNKVLTTHHEKPLMPSQIKSILTKKRDIFTIKGERISIHPDKHPFTLKASIDGFSGTSYKVYVDFMENRFIFFEWRTKENKIPFTLIPVTKQGNIEEFKRELYSLKIWEWEPNYHEEEGIILEGKYWSVRLCTEGKVYESEGIGCFPANWSRFYKAIEKLTGARFR